MSSKKKSSRKQVYDLGDGHYFQIHYEILDSKAYRLLSTTAKAIWTEMYREFMRASYWATLDIDKKGFTFPLSQCRVTHHRDTFTKAVDEIVQKGFFRRAHELQELRPGAPHRYVYSTAWRTYTPTKEEAEAMRKRQVRKERKNRRDLNRLTDYMQSQGQPDKSEGDSWTANKWVPSVECPPDQKALRTTQNEAPNSHLAGSAPGSSDTECQEVPMSNFKTIRTDDPTCEGFPLLFGSPTWECFPEDEFPSEVGEEELAIGLIHACPAEYRALLDDFPIVRLDRVGSAA